MGGEKVETAWLCYDILCFFFFKQKTAYEIYQCDWSSDVCSSDLAVKKTHLVTGLKKAGADIKGPQRLPVVDLRGDRSGGKYLFRAPCRVDQRALHGPVPVVESSSQLSRKNAGLPAITPSAAAMPDSMA